ncbi:hypothetical protein B0H99_10126 [Planomicrobium soli]|uniref:Uncharacterized protein n=1 Tax=Planomicrobium soli TaxID=1176648 RepID=A0A2P8H6F5_9BACL|nr:hypothetical protein [Planomicrobium soli]PSL41783.1 hypothetical protein B0H99_10126 [Planomicrobium soli]
MADYFKWSFNPYLLFLLIVAVFSLVRFKLTIYAEKMVYEILLVNKSIIKKKILPIHINQMKFIRVGWAQKAAIIKVKKGINVRLVVLEPPKAYDHLIEFATIHDIPIAKTKDYLILERMKKFSD